MKESLHHNQNIPLNLQDLKQKFIRGGTITFIAQGISVAIQLLSTIILARLLSPDDYGVIAMVLAITAFAGLFRDMGLSSAVIQKQNLTHPQQSNLFWLNVGMGALLTIVVAAASPLVAWFYKKPELTALTLLLSSTFLIGSIGTQHGALMQRELQFGRKAVASIAGSLITLVVAVILAWKGYAYWALAWGMVLGGGGTTILLFVFSSFRPGFWTRGAGIRSMLKFGANVTMFDLVNYFQRNLDNILIGRFWGADALGLYSRAYQLLMLPINNIRGPINTVAFPALSRLRNRPEVFREYYLKTTTLVAFVSMPIVGFLFVNSDILIKITMGEKWLGCVPIFSILAVAAFTQPTTGLAGTLMMSLGQSKRYFICGLANALFLSVCILIGVYWGEMGVAISYLIGNYIILYPWLNYALKESPVTLLDLFNACLVPLYSTIIAVILVFFLNKSSILIKADTFMKISTVTAIYFFFFSVLTLSNKTGRRYIIGIIKNKYDTIKN